MNEDNKYQLLESDLEKLHILRRVSRESVLGLLERCRILELTEGEILLEAQQTNQTMFMILKGKLNVHLDDPESEPVATLKAGELVGELSVIDDSPASACVTAATTTRLLCVDEETFWRLVGASHEFASNLLLLLADRLRSSNFTIKRNVKLKERFERDALMDGLTGLHNRRWLDETLPRLISRFQFNKKPLCIVILDVDHFKRFNDTYGHVAGDEVLATVSKSLRGKLRPTDLGARYGGEEFVTILSDTDLEGAKIAAERLRKAVEMNKVVISDGRTLPPVTISLGIAQAGPSDNAESLIKRADTALYKAKDSGRNRVECAG